jgi:hypothetical protein
MILHRPLATSSWWYPDERLVGVDVTELAAPPCFVAIVPARPLPSVGATVAMSSCGFGIPWPTAVVVVALRVPLAR